MGPSPGYSHLNTGGRAARCSPSTFSHCRVSFGDWTYDCGFCRDISERERLERTLRVTRLVVDQAPEPITWLGPDGRIVYANQAACDLAGLLRRRARGDARVGRQSGVLNGIVV